MGRYEKTAYPSILKYFGKKGPDKEKKPVYVIDFYASGKRHREKVGPLLDEAKSKLQAIKDRARDGGYVPQSVKKKITLGTVIDDYKKNREGNGYYERAEKYHLDTLKEYLGQKRLCEITPQVIEDFKKERKRTPLKWVMNRREKIEARAKEQKRDLTPKEKEEIERLSQQLSLGRSDTSVNRELEILRRVLSKAVLNGKLEKNPFKRFVETEETIFEEETERVRSLTVEELNRLLEVSPIHLQRIIKGAVFTGLRKGDLLKVKWSDINFEGQYLTYYQQKKRGKKEEIKPLIGDMIALLEEIPKTGEYVFTGPDGEPIKDVRRAFKTALRKAGIKDFRFHDLRHTSASLLLMRGAPMKVIQEHLGHSSIAMTQRYAHIADQYQREQTEKLNGVFSGVSGKSKVTSEKLVRKTENEEIPQNVNFASA